MRRKWTNMCCVWLHTRNAIHGRNSQMECWSYLRRCRFWRPCRRASWSSRHSWDLGLRQSQLGLRWGQLFLRCQLPRQSIWRGLSERGTAPRTVVYQRKRLILVATGRNITLSARHQSITESFISDQIRLAESFASCAARTSKIEAC